MFRVQPDHLVKNTYRIENWNNVTQKMRAVIFWHTWHFSKQTRAFRTVRWQVALLKIPAHPLRTVVQVWYLMAEYAAVCGHPYRPGRDLITDSPDKPTKAIPIQYKHWESYRYALGKLHTIPKSAYMFMCSHS